MNRDNPDWTMALLLLVLISIIVIALPFSWYRIGAILSYLILGIIAGYSLRPGLEAIAHLTVAREMREKLVVLYYGIGTLPGGIYPVHLKEMSDEQVTELFHAFCQNEEFCSAVTSLKVNIPTTSVIQERMNFAGSDWSVTDVYERVELLSQTILRDIHRMSKPVSLPAE